MKTFKIVLFTAVLTGFISCEERSNYTDGESTLAIVESVRIAGKVAEIDHLMGKIHVSLSGGTNLGALPFEAKAPEGISLNPSSGSTIDLTNGNELIVSNGTTQKAYSISATLLPSKIAFIGDGATLADISDDDVREAGLWASQHYGANFIYIPYDQLVDGALDEVNVLFYMHDAVGTSDQPQAVLDRINVISKFFVLGGKIVAGSHGTGLVEELGRDTSGLRTIIGTGAGGDNPDDWGIGFVNNDLGSTLSSGCTFNDAGNVFVIDGGYKEDHNALWNLGSLDDPKFASFASTYNAEVIAAWDWALGGQGFGGIVLFNPSGRFKGHFLALGIGGMEWNMNDGRTNAYAENVRAIYRNAIDYLMAK
jgi:hypothetical protein